MQKMNKIMRLWANKQMDLCVLWTDRVLSFRKFTFASWSDRPHSQPQTAPNLQMLRHVALFCGFCGNSDKSRSRRERQPSVDKKAQGIRNPQTVSGSRICFKWTHLTVNSIWLANWSILRFSFLICTVSESSSSHLWF